MMYSTPVSVAGFGTNHGETSRNYDKCTCARPWHLQVMASAGHVVITSADGDGEEGTTANSAVDDNAHRRQPWTCPGSNIVTCRHGRPMQVTMLRLARCHNISSQPERYLRVLLSLVAFKCRACLHHMHKVFWFYVLAVACRTGVRLASRCGGPTQGSDASLCHVRVPAWHGVVNHGKLQCQYCVVAPPY